MSHPIRVPAVQGLAPKDLGTTGLVDYVALNHVAQRPLLGRNRSFGVAVRELRRRGHGDRSISAFREACRRVGFRAVEARNPGAVPAEKFAGFR